MGITARGAWEAVKRHFREMDIDIQTTPFSVAGVGDMSGDVFGNGMLLSPKIRLVAAFDHRDIFIDPDPDMAASLTERKRLFALPRSSWQDYDKSILSNGAMIISRQEKSVTLTAEAAAVLGLDQRPLSPFEIMTAILKAEVDLLWFGGIGTYIKAPEETDAEVGDRANDSIRITGADVRAKVIGEGANLGVTARGRVAYGLKGGRCNSDAIDNSAGVNSSDIEVNIKIALANAMREQRLTRPDRDILLASMTDEVASLVLRNNYLQTLSISLTERLGTQAGSGLSRLMQDLESIGALNRKVEFLPDELTMAERYASGKPLTRAEIGILLSYAKIALFDEIITSELPDDPWFQAALLDYFPEKMQGSNAEDIRTHRLHREIIATILANDVINRGGPAFVSTMRAKTGADASSITKAAVLIRDGFDLTSIWTQIDSLDGRIPGEIQNGLYAIVSDFYQSAIENALNTGASTGPLTQAIDSLQSAVTLLQPGFKSVLPRRILDEMAMRELELAHHGVSGPLVEILGGLEALATLPEIMQIAASGSVSLIQSATDYIKVSEDFSISKLLSLGRQLRPSDAYEEQALSTCLSEIATARSNLIAAGFKTGKAKAKSANAPTDLAKDLDRMKMELSMLTKKSDMTLAKIVVASGLLNQLARYSSK